MTVQELKQNLPQMYFIKTKKTVTEPDYYLLKEAYIPDSDSYFPEPNEVTGRTRIFPLSVTAYPGVLKRMTAMEAGAWAFTKCKQQHWELSLDNVQCCLANLEMDF